MKLITHKHAQKWLDKLKIVNNQTYLQVIKCLRKYQRTQNEYDCFLSLNKALINDTQMIKELNLYLQDTNKFISQNYHEKRMDLIIQNIRNTNRKGYQKIIEIIQSIEPKQNTDLEVQNQIPLLQVIINKLSKEQQDLKLFILNELEQECSANLISSKNIDYLKTCKVKKRFSIEDVKKKIRKQTTLEHSISKKITTYSKTKEYSYKILSSVSEEKNYFKKLQRKNPFLFQNFSKLIYLYIVGVITKNQLMSLSSDQFQLQLSSISEIISSRQTDRRKWSPFRPLSDIDFANSKRETFSYIKKPSTYPTFASNCTQYYKTILNQCWVSVPFGSEQSFNIRVKNNYELNLLKTEDQIYQLDIFLLKSKKSLELIKKIIFKLTNNLDIYIEQKNLINFGIIQTLFKNISEQQKQQIQFYLSEVPLHAYNFLEKHVETKIKQLCELRNQLCQKQWIEAYNQNFNNSLNIRCFEFKRIQKEKMKPSFFVNDLCNKKKLYNDQIIQNPKMQYKIFNCFTDITGAIQFNNRNYPCLSYEISSCLQKQKLPEHIFSFENRQILGLLFNYLFNYIYIHVNSDLEKNKNIQFLYKIAVKIFGCEKHMSFKKLKNFHEDKFQEILQVQVLFFEQQEIQNEIFNSNMKTFCFSNLDNSYSTVVPSYNHTFNLVYQNENLYIMIRFFYCLYERFLKGCECSTMQEFEKLILSSLKSRETVKLQETMNKFSNGSGYIFAGIHRIADQLIKYVSILSNCNICKQSLKFMAHVQHQEIYYYLYKQYCKLKGGTLKIIRFLYDNETNLMYIKMMGEVDNNFLRQEVEQCYLYNVQQYLTFPDGQEYLERPNTFYNNILYNVEKTSGKLINTNLKTDVFINSTKIHDEILYHQQMKRVMTLFNL